MDKYSLILSKNATPDTKIPIKEVVINKHGKTVFEIFLEGLISSRPQWKKAVTALGIIEGVANGQHYTDRKYKYVGHQSEFNIYEAIKGDIRIYTVHLDNSIIIVGGSKKGENQQSRDIAALDPLIETIIQDEP